MKPGASPAPTDDAAIRFGLASGIAAYAIWGLFPIYFKAIDGAGAIEILAHRIIWGAPFAALVIFFRRQWGEVAAAFGSPRVMLMLTISAAAIAGNWGIYVWAVVSDHIFQASLGYYINPLVYVATGVLVLGEKLRLAQIIAVALAAIGVLALTFGAGHFPWAAISLALLFTAYGYIRKTAPVGAVPGLFVETAVLAPFAVAYLIWLMNAGSAAFGNEGHGQDFLLVLAGPITVVPLAMFAMAARRLRLSTLGFLQYIAPTGQFLLGLFYGEAFTLAHAICFGLIWAALAIFSVDAWRANRAEKTTKHAPPVIQPVSASPKNS